MNDELYNEVKHDHQFLPIYDGRTLMENYDFNALDENRYYYVHDVYHGQAVPLHSVNYDELYEECLLDYAEHQSVGDNTYYDPMSLEQIDTTLKQQLIDHFGEDRVNQCEIDESINYLLEEMLFAFGFKQLYTKLCQAQ